jgi:SAM-dependent methyltransferase
MRTSQKDNRTLEQEILRISDGGERVTHLRPNGCYLAHLSIYRFALQFVQASVVLDMGSGSGYGTAYLAENGAAFVEGVDVSDKAVAFSQQHFALDNVRYRVGDLQQIAGFEDRTFDVIFSSNTFEHVSNILAAWREVWRLLKPGGCFILAVPPIANEPSREMNVANPYHLHIWSPRQWHHVLGLFFDEIQSYSHVFARPGPLPNFFADPAETNFNEKDFAFEPISLDDMYHVPSMTAIYVARAPRPEYKIPRPEDEISFVDDSFSRSLLSVLQELSEENQRLRAQLAKINEGIVRRVLNKAGAFRRLFKK